VTRAGAAMVLAAGLLAGACAPAGPQAEGGGARPRAPQELSAAKVDPFQMGRPDVVLLWTCGTYGMMEICDCAAGDWSAGLSRRGGLLHSYRRAFGPAVYALDAGEWTPLDPNDIRTPYVLDAYANAGYDALTLGVNEWSAGDARLAELLAGRPMRLLAGNISSPAAGELPLESELPAEVNGVRLAVVAFCPESSLLFLEPERREDLRVGTLQAFVDRVERLKRDGRLVVAVVAGDDESARQIANASEADVVVRAYTPKAAGSITQAAGGAWIVKVGGYELVGALALKVSGGKVTAAEFRAEPVDARWPIDERNRTLFRQYAAEAVRRMKAAAASPE